jgi:NADH-quinone oxidoreductase subunit L
MVSSMMAAATSIPTPDFLSQVVTILVFPLVTAVFLLLFGRRIQGMSLMGRSLSHLPGYLAVGAFVRSFFVALGMFFDLGTLPGHAEGAHENGRSISVHLFDWIQAGNLDVGAGFLIDQLAVVMALVITGVGSLIAVYSTGYMADDKRYSRYFAYLTLFAFSMLLLVFADNILLMYVGWEGVGLCSYLLIGFWFERPAAANAAKKAFIVNRIGDFSFLLGIILLAGVIGSLTVGQINDSAVSGLLGGGMATLAALLLFGGAVGKSAQIPLYVWLPDAMEGPTPASALIHAATMVTAGVYMVARFFPVFEASSGDVALTIVAWTGALTALWAALIAATQHDIKKVLAYSTVSQLGYMFLANGLGAYSAGIFHLVTHAFFKALLFLGAGSVMHSLAGNVDMRKMGGLRKVMPITGWTFLAGVLAISGIVPFAGFFSKDAILAVAWEQGEYLLWLIGIGTAFLTAFYMGRLYFRVFEGETVYPEGAHPHESPWSMAGPLVALAVLSVFGGVINLPGVLTLEHYLEPALGGFEVPHGLTAWVLGAVALVAGVGGLVLSSRLYLTEPGRDLRSRLRAGSWLDKLVGASRSKFWVDEWYGGLIVLPGKQLATLAAYSVDARMFDGVVNGTGRLVALTSDIGRKVQSGYIRNYALAFLVGVVLVLSVLVLRIGG